MPIFGNQLMAGRALVDIDQKTLAKEAGITEQTLRRMEATGTKRLVVALRQCKLSWMPSALAAWRCCQEVPCWLAQGPGLAMLRPHDSSRDDFGSSP